MTASEKTTARDLVALRFEARIRPGLRRAVKSSGANARRRIADLVEAGLSQDQVEALFGAGGGIVRRGPLL